MDENEEEYPDMSALFAGRGNPDSSTARQFREILGHLKQSDEMMQMVALQELAEVLSITTGSCLLFS
jgi:hypothetical protein